jgi:eukaryotic-like serine/threonine-protein kinase
MNSEVFLVQDHQLEAQLVMKYVAKAVIPHSADYFAEARRLHDARHRHVVDVKYACSDDTHIYLAMPYYRGGTLHSLIETRFMTVREIVRYGLEFLSGLHHVHVKGLVHLDVKPTNILLDDADTASLADFGLSREVTGHGLAEMPVVYVPHMPPERLTAIQVAKSADVYQAGLTLYRMSVGHAEFDRQQNGFGPTLHNAILAGTFPDRNQFLPHIPPRLRDVVATALAINPDDRPRTVLDLMNALARVDESLDWRYEPASGPVPGGARSQAGTWSESGPDGAGRRVSLTPAAKGGWTVHASRVAVSGRQQRVARFCKDDLTSIAALRLVRVALKGPWN